MDLSIVNSGVSSEVLMHQFVYLSNYWLERGEHPYFELFSDLAQAVVEDIDGGEDLLDLVLSELVFADVVNYVHLYFNLNLTYFGKGSLSDWYVLKIWREILNIHKNALV